MPGLNPHRKSRIYSIFVIFSVCGRLGFTGKSSQSALSSCIVGIDKIKKSVSIYSFADQINKVTDGQQYSEMLLKPGEWLLAKRFVVSTAVAKPQNERIWR